MPGYKHMLLVNAIGVVGHLFQHSNIHVQDYIATAQLFIKSTYWEVVGWPFLDKYLETSRSLNLKNHSWKFRHWRAKFCALKTLFCNRYIALLSCFDFFSALVLLLHDLLRESWDSSHLLS